MRLIHGAAATVALALLSGTSFAQAGRTTAVHTTIVVDFVNRAGVAGTGLERFATDAVAVELAGSGRYEVLKRTEVERAAKALNLRAPFDKIDVQRLARSLGADTVVTGEISFVRREQQKGATQVTVGMKIRVMDPDSGELVGGASPVATVEERRR